MSKIPDPRMRNFTAKKALIEELIRRFDLDTKQLQIFTIRSHANHKTKA